MCIWESALGQFNFSNIGVCEARSQFRTFAEPCHCDWMASDFDDPFDWEYVPKWLDLNVVVEPYGFQLADVRRQP